MCSDVSYMLIGSVLLPLPPDAMMSTVIALIRREDDQRVFAKPEVFQRLDNPACVRIHAANQRRVSLFAVAIVEFLQGEERLSRSASSHARDAPAAALITDGQTLVLARGSTSKLRKNLFGRPVQVIPNSVPVSQ